jgi:type I restriction-modification system DNA methylase subunit
MENLRRLVARFDENYASYQDKGYNESACRLEFIDGLLRAFGWDVSNERNHPPNYKEVIVEDYDRETGRPDYSLRLSGVTKFFVEAKKPSVAINRDFNAVFQARSYGWSAKHPIVVLTNFENLLIYDTTVMPSHEDAVEVALIGQYHYLEYEQKYEEISGFISRKCVYSGEFDTSFLNHHGLQKQVDEIFLEQINRWRLELGGYLYTAGYEIDIINDTIQEFINQIIFLRICEDRNLPTYKKLVEAISDEARVKESLQELYIQADKRYNSGLFKGDYLIFDLDNHIIVDIIKTLYYPNSPYVFNLIDSTLLGQIYEMFLIKHLVINEADEVVLQDKRQNVNRSVVSTPVEIVKYMTSKSVTTILKGMTPAEVKTIRLADIAVGSGVFLVEAYESVLNYCVEWYIAHDKGHLIPLGGDNYKLPLEEKKEILVACIFGVDIDAHAVEVAKFSLLLKLLEDENSPSVVDEQPILPPLDQNLMVGNSLIDSEMVTKYKASDDILDIVPFDFSCMNGGKPFDLIIGNPPYVKSEDMKALLPPRELAIYKKRYQVSYRQFDKYFIFIERALELLKDKGVLSYIVPNKFSKNKSGEELRRMLTQQSYVTEFVDFGSAQLFEDKTIYSAILFLRKHMNDTFTFREVDNLKEWWLTKDEASNRSQLSHSLLTEKAWVLVADLTLAQRLSNLYVDAIPLKSIATPFVGIQTSAEAIKIGEEKKPAYWFLDSDVVEEDEEKLVFNRFGETFTVEKGILKRYFKPVTKGEKGNASYDACVTNKWIIFPYDSHGDLIPIERMGDEFPGTLQYLEFIYEAIEPKQFGNGGRRDVPQATPDSWYRYGRHQSFKNFFGTDKLIVGVMSKKPMFMRDKNSYVVASGDTAGYAGIKALEGSPYSLEFIQAYLSHPLIEKVFSIIGSDFDNGFYSRGKSVMDIIPVKRINFENTIEKQRHNDIIVKTNEIYHINEECLGQISKKDRIVLQRRKEQLINEIMEIIDQILC